MKPLFLVFTSLLLSSLVTLAQTTSPTPISTFFQNRLTYDMWRACRLVIDVGLHKKSWTKEQATSYLADRTALSLVEVNTEVNRYISWPGQALAYKIGELKILEMRKKTENALKENFDVRAFHDMILSNGSVTLSVLEKITDRFIEEKLNRAKSESRRNRVKRRQNIY